VSDLSLNLLASRPEELDIAKALLSRPVVYVRYWGSHFKSDRQVKVFAAEFKPMLDRGWSCRLVLERVEKPFNIELLRQMGVEIDYFPRPQSVFEFKWFLRVWLYFRRVRPSAVACDNITIVPLAAALLAGVPIRVWRKRSMNAFYEEVRKPSLKDRLSFTTRLTVSLATFVTTVSAAVRQQLVDLGMDGRKIFVRRNSRPEFAVPVESRDAVRQRFGYTSSDVVIATVGHAVPVKGWDILLKVFRNVAARDTNAKLLLIGSVAASYEKPTHDELQTFIREHRLGDRVKFTGQIFNVVDVLQAADIYVHPSRSEGFSNALLEALHVRIPCVSATVGDAETLIQNRVNGFLIERCDERGFEEAISRLVTDHELRRCFAQCAKLPEGMQSLAEYAEQFVQDIGANSSLSR
jgi:glycosyltransferase involved in cell wall biosynthesis